LYGILFLLFIRITAFAQEILVGLTPEGGPFGGGTAFSMNTDGTAFTVNRKFIKAGVLPHGELIKGTDGYFYGMTSSGSSNGISTTGYGTIFKMTTTGTIISVKDLDYSITGSSPYGSLLQAADGNFYSMTSMGGSHGYGAIFKMSPGGAISILKYLDTISGGMPQGSLIQAADGNFYGMTNEGGTYGSGTIFKVTSTGVLTVLKSLNSNVTGSNPYGGLVVGSDGNFYGMTSGGGANGYGTVFKITPTGIFTILKSLDYFVTGGNPKGNLIRATDGNFYGMTYAGGTNGAGTIFKITSSGVLTVVKHLDATTGTNPYGSLTQGSDGNFYGMAAQGGTYNFGTIFKCTPSGTLTVLRSLNYAADGGYPYGSLYRNSDGYFYGMTSSGGTNYDYTGTAFKISSTGTYTVLFHFPDGALGFNPSENLIQARDGYYYGMAHNGGKSNYGAIFKLCNSGVLTSLRSFDYNNNGGYSDGSLIQGIDGNFYGMATSGGTYLNGTIFKMTASGTLTVLKQLNASITGSFPYGRLVQGIDSNFYGIANSGGTYDYGTIFKITPKGVFTVLKHLSSATGGYAYGSLVQGNDGNFYGITSRGGTNDAGTIFKITPTGILTVLKNFDYFNMGANPWGSLMKGSDGNFYGMTAFGGLNFNGTIFKVTSTGTFSVLKQLDTTSGVRPKGDLVQGSDGTLYGMTSEGGRYNVGTIFKITTNGTFSILRNLNYGTDGGYPTGSLIIQKPNPIANPQIINTSQNTIKKIKLTATASGTLVTFAVSTKPKNGSAAILKDTLTYTPNTNYTGLDSLYFTATWGCQKSIPAKIKITVTSLTPMIVSTEEITFKSQNALGEKLFVTAIPNPSTSYFTITTQTISNQLLTIVVMDAVGRIIEIRNNIASNNSIIIGKQFQSGLYYIEIIQGSEKLRMKLLKK
jgi:uncharacterized repeat protein (TIGR03803 family)